MTQPHFMCRHQFFPQLPKKTVSYLLKISSNGAQAFAPYTATHDLPTPSQRARASSAIGKRSQYSISLPPEHYDEVAEDEDDDYDNDDANFDRAGLSDDSLLQHPLSVCASRAVSSGDLYRPESIEFQYPVCKLDDPSSPLDQELENGLEVYFKPSVGLFLSSSFAYVLTLTFLNLDTFPKAFAVLFQWHTNRVTFAAYNF